MKAVFYNLGFNFIYLLEMVCALFSIGFIYANECAFNNSNELS